MSSLRITGVLLAGVVFYEIYFVIRRGVGLAVLGAALLLLRGCTVVRHSKRCSIMLSKDAAMTTRR